MSINMVTAPRLSVSTWSLHRTLGLSTSYGPGDTTLPSADEGALPLLELPARLAEFGIATLEICHFHLPSLDPSYLNELRDSLQQSHIELFSLLVDAGDVTHPTEAARDLAWISSWLPIAGLLGARCARVIAGKSAATPSTLQTSAGALSQLAEVAETAGVRLMTENWLTLLSEPAAVHILLDRLAGRVGLCLDFGNWRGPDKYDDMRSIAPYAESCHAKAHFDSPDAMDKEDYIKCLELTRAANFAGPYTLIYDGPDPDEWAGLASERELVLPYLNTPAV
ncbi:MAG: TIM barrel protein [Ktedonobacteraceae bacterium]